MLPNSKPQKSKTSDANREEVFIKYRYPLLFILIGAILISSGAFLIKNRASSQLSNIKVLESSRDAEKSNSNEVVIEIVGAVVSPGVYRLPINSRIEDVLIAAGGLSANADRYWMERSLNRAAKVSSRQKIYVPRVDEQFDVASASNIAGYQTISSFRDSNLIETVNINTATPKELESLWGIGPITAQNIIEQRPYSNALELLEKQIIKPNVFEINKSLLTIY